MGTKAVILHEAKKGLIASLVAKPINFVKDIKTVSVAVHYTTRSNPDVRRGREFTFDVDKTKETLNKFFRRGERDMAAYQYKIIYLNEMGEEEVEFVETVQERDTRMQSLADDGYSPVWREVSEHA